MDFEDFAEVNAAMQRAKQLQLQRQLLEKIDNLNQDDRNRPKSPPKYSDSLTEEELSYYEDLSEKQFEREEQIRISKRKAQVSAMKPVVITCLVILVVVGILKLAGVLGH